MNENGRRLRWAWLVARKMAGQVHSIFITEQIGHINASSTAFAQWHVVENGDSDTSLQPETLIECQGILTLSVCRETPKLQSAVAESTAHSCCNSPSSVICCLVALSRPFHDFVNTLTSTSACLIDPPYSPFHTQARNTRPPRNFFCLPPYGFCESQISLFRF